MDKELIIQIKARLEERINQLKIPDSQKSRMREALIGIFLSPHGGLYLIDTSEFQRYLTVRKQDETPYSPYDFCIVDRVIDKDSNSTAERNFDFPSLTEIAEILEENKDIIYSEIVDALNYQKGELTLPEENNEKHFTESHLYKELIKKHIREKKNISDFRLRRIYDVLDAISDASMREMRLYRDGGYEEIILTNEFGSMQYCKLQKMQDFGSNSNRRITRLSIDELIEYIDEHKTELDPKVIAVKRAKAMEAARKSQEESR